jgi:hypothetical protein
MRRGERGCKADGESHQHYCHALPQYHPQDIAAAGSEREADTDLAGTGGDGVGHDAIETHGGQQQPDAAEQRAQVGGHALAGDGSIHLIAQRENAAIMR